MRKRKILVPALVMALAVAVQADITVANFVNGTGGTAATADGSGLAFTTASFDMSGGNTVAFMVSCEGAGDSSSRDAYFAGQLMDKVDVTEGIQSSTLFYLVNPSTTSGSFSYYLDSGVSTDYAYSQISLNNVLGVAGTDLLHTTTSDPSTPVYLNYTTSTAGGFVLGCAVNNDYNNARILSVESGNPDTDLLSHTVYGTFGSLHTYGDVPTAGVQSDGYYGQYARTAITTVAFDAVVPEPATLGLVGLMGGGLLFIRRRFMM